MTRQYLGLVALLSLTSLGVAAPASAAELELALPRLRVGDCAATDAEGQLVLRTGGVQTLRPDQVAFSQLVAQLGQAMAPVVLAPVSTSGPVGFDVAIETTVTDLDQRDSALARGTRGADSARETCAGQNERVRSALVTNRLHVEKGLPYGFSVGALVGRVHQAGSYLVGVDLKIALLEEVWHSRLPDLALRAALNRLVGERDLALSVAAFDVIVSERFVLLQRFELSPWLGAGVQWTHARTGRIDLTPNIDALACRAGTDPLCDVSGLGASEDDLGHDVRFAAVSQLRLRAFVGLWLRYRQVALSSSLSLDALEPHVGERGRGETVARQWTVSVAPTLSF